MPDMKGRVHTNMEQNRGEEKRIEFNRREKYIRE